MDNAVLALAKDIIFIDFEIAHRKLEPGRNEEIFNFAGEKKINSALLLLLLVGLQSARSNGNTRGDGHFAMSIAKR